MFGIETITTNAIASMAGYIAYLAFTFAGKGIAGMATFLNIAIHMRPYPKMPVIIGTWTIVRDLSNMFFVVILIVMAFATIFNYGEKYKFSGDLILRLLIAAVLINFSLVLGGMIIDVTQAFNAIFLNAIGDVGDRLGAALDPAGSLLPALKDSDLSAAAVPDLVTSSIFSLIFAFILEAIVLFGLVVATIFAFLRIPILWLLLILSPIAFMARILPESRGQWDKWLKYFIGWNLYLPIYLFFLYLGLMFLSAKPQVDAAVVQALGTGAANQAFGDGLLNSFTFTTVVFYFFVAWVLTHGSVGAVNLAMSFGQGAGWGVKKATDWAWNIRGFSDYRAARKAAGEKMTEYKEKGVPIGGGRRLFGAEGQKEREALWARRFNVGGNLEQQKKFAGSIDKEISKLKDLERIGKIKVDANFADNTDNMAPEGIARRSILYERGMIKDANQFGQDVVTWTQKNPFLAENMINKARQGGFKNVNASQLLEMASGQGNYASLKSPAGSVVRKQLYNSLLGDKDIPGLDAALSSMALPQMREAISLLGGNDSNDATKFKKSLADKRPDLVAEYNADIDPNPVTVEEKLFDLIKDKKASDIANMPADVWGKPLFEQVLRTKISTLNTAVPPIPEGDFFAGVTPPLGIPPANVIPIRGGFVVPGIPGANQGIGWRKYKGRLGGGDKFKADLERATSSHIVKNRIAANL